MALPSPSTPPTLGGVGEEVLEVLQVPAVPVGGDAGGGEGELLLGRLLGPLHPHRRRVLGGRRGLGVGAVLLQRAQGGRGGPCLVLGVSVVLG
jgi:hypothetical protein